MWCLRYIKDTNFKANHNSVKEFDTWQSGVCDISKIQILKQITTNKTLFARYFQVSAIYQRYKF